MSEELPESIPVTLRWVNKPPTETTATRKGVDDDGLHAYWIETERSFLWDLVGIDAAQIPARSSLNFRKLIL